MTTVRHSLTTVAINIAQLLILGVTATMTTVRHSLTTVAINIARLPLSQNLCHKILPSPLIHCFLPHVPPDAHHHQLYEHCHHEMLPPNRLLG